MNTRAQIIPAGSVISVDMGAYRHYAIAASGPYGATAIAPSGKATKVIEEPLESLMARGRDFRVEPIWGRFDGVTVVARARQMLGRQYDLLVFNCEHFVRLVHGLKPKSPQLIGAGLSLLLLILVILGMSD